MIERASDDTPDGILKWLEMPYEYFSKEIFRHNTDSVLDCASGNGVNQKYLYERLFDVHSADYHDNEIGLPRYAKTDLNELLPFSDNQFDYVFSFETIEHLRPDNHRQFVSELLRVAKKEVIIGTVAEDGNDYAFDDLIFKKRNGLNPFHLYEYSIKNFYEFFRNYDNVSFYSSTTYGSIVPYLGQSETTLSVFVRIKK